MSAVHPMYSIEFLNVESDLPVARWEKLDNEIGIGPCVCPISDTQMLVCHRFESDKGTGFTVIDLEKRSFDFLSSVPF